MTLDPLDPRIVELCKETKLTEQDIRDLVACDSAQDLLLLIQTYEAAGKAPDRGFWGRLGQGLREAEQYAPLVSMLASVIPLL